MSEITEEEREILRQAGSIIARIKTPQKSAAARENGKAGGRPKGSGRPISPEAVERMKAAQQARRERERAGIEEGTANQ